MFGSGTGHVSLFKYIKNLKGLILIETDIKDYSPLYDLKNPEFLILSEDFFKEGHETEREELKKRLPDSHIVCGQPFCLGSGWIVIVPLFIIFCLVFIVCFKKIMTHTKKRLNL